MSNTAFFVLDLALLLIFVAVGVAGVYLWAVALASVSAARRAAQPGRQHRFAVAIPAHNEGGVVTGIVASLRQADYPQEMYDVFVAADHCTDSTADKARAAGATCFERAEGEERGKGAALRWLFERIFEIDVDYDSIIVFDADTQVDPGFLRWMNARLCEGTQAVQGRHVISNPREGWFPALSWAMMTIDNRFSNQGRANLGLSAKHMGDSICFRSDVLRELGWGSGLTEDYDFRLRLLSEGICIDYEPQAVGYGEAPLTWREAQAQRTRWHAGRAEAKKRHTRRLLREGIRRRDLAMVDGAIGSLIPSYSTLTLISAAAFLVHLVIGPYLWPALTYLWGAMTLTWFLYPLFGLALEKAPAWAYLAIMSGSIFIVWRTWLSLRVRLSRTRMDWVRTPHRGVAPPGAGT